MKRVSLLCLILLFAVLFFVCTDDVLESSDDAFLLSTHQRSQIANSILVQKVDFEEPDAFDKSIEEYRVPPLQPYNCTVNTPFPASIDHSNVIRLNDPHFTCNYRTVERGVGMGEVETGEWKAIQGETTRVSTDVTEVQCNSTHLSNSTIRSHILSAVPRENYNNATGRPFEPSSPSRPSVLLLIIDSISLSAARRQMPRTMREMENDGFVVMKKYTKVHRNTRPNMFALHAGVRLREYQDKSGEIREEKDPIDKVDFTWRKFSRAGYISWFDEDSPFWSSFDRFPGGHGAPPAVHDISPLHRFSPATFTSSVVCMHEKSIFEEQWTHVMRFHHTYSRLARFSVSWVTSLSHLPGTEEHMGYGDAVLEKVLSENRDIFNDTFVIVMSDHGHLYDRRKATTVGQMEQILPLFAVRVPDSLNTLYPHLRKNLLLNSARFVTHYDTFEMLSDIARGDFRERRGDAEVERGISLFSPIPRRSCDDVEIPSEYCIMRPLMEHEVSSGARASLYANVSRAVFDHVNRLLEQGNMTNICTKLSDPQVERMYQTNMGNGFRFWEGGDRYLLRAIVKSDVNNVQFEASLEWSAGSVDLIVKGVSRQDKYSPRARCAGSSPLKEYCVCKQL